MRERKYQVLTVLVALAVLAGAPAMAASKLWLHVTVDEDGGAKVTVNLPLALAEKALPMIPFDEKMRWRHDHDHHGIDLEEMRELWAEVKNSPDMTFVTAEDDGETVRVWKETGFVYVQVGEDDGDEQVDVQVPLSVVDAFFSGDELDFAAAIQALADSGGGDLVTVRDDGDNVRVWIDETPEARSSSR
ncbi:MAG: hypothetical protein ACE5GX_05455 [Thermoanaerobaculia bacterium]